MRFQAQYCIIICTKLFTHFFKIKKIMNSFQETRKYCPESDSKYPLKLIYNMNIMVITGL